MRILIVDDDPLAAEMAAAILEDLGYEGLTAESAVEGFETLNDHPDVGLIISDMNMPLVDGVEFFRELREQGNQTPFVLLTGDDPEAARSREPGLDGCLLKDFSLEETLPEIVSETLKRYEKG